jgi:hypothetical protein
MSNYPWYPGKTTYNYKQQIVYLMQVNNLGTSDATNIVSTYIVGPGLKVVGFNAIQPGTLTFNNLTNTITWTISHLGGNSYAAASVLLESLTTGTGNNFALNASIILMRPKHNQPQLPSTDNTILTITPSADIQVNQTVNNTNPQPGNYVTITITTTNNGPRQRNRNITNRPTTNRTNSRHRPQHQHHHHTRNIQHNNRTMEHRKPNQHSKQQH